MGVFDPIVQALSSPGPQTDHSTHTTQQLPTQPSGTLNRVGHDSRDMEDLRRSRDAQLARMGLNPDRTPMKVKK